ncbi:MAG: methylthioribulose-1-phosphate dehydratase [Acidiphilium sp. 20-67-58]|uniref:methylthioribulose 1-phosphate dehydratase n=2 Tax=unclassified Acidiphilium TaxID=2617493 RepID=UPI000BD89E47|nr:MULTISPECIES: methylthioribulose 1-phosphate dehydratase [unclassified Acidiphilium]OYV56283.1 MAG: methylthioribulose-1-phosphate dehydratase [Acidiphilium sp. 20-67-58]HQT61076.1 methylthioribulose 1-phosphate dehydratase [Acidiphilium sp.]
MSAMPAAIQADTGAELASRAGELVAIGARMDRKGWVPASSGNLSARLGAGRIAITRSGVHKGRLASDDIIEVGMDGAPLRAGDRPSAETLLHCQIYEQFPGVGAVLHGHSVAATALSLTDSAPAIQFEGYEILKAFPGIATHQTKASLPVFENDQDMRRLAATIAPALQAAPIGYVLRGHGVYAWGEDVERSFWRLEALEFLLSCECERRRIR